MLSIYPAERNDCYTDWHRLPPRAYNSLICVLCLHFASSMHNAEAARSLSARSLLRARLCASRFSRLRRGTLKGDNRMQSINHSIHLISAIAYTAPFARSRIARRPVTRARSNGRDRMRQSNKIFTIPNKLSKRGIRGHDRRQIQITGVSPRTTLFARLNSALGSARRYKTDDKARSRVSDQCGSRGHKRQS